MPGCIRDPKEGASIRHAQPTVDVSADLDDGLITSGDFPSRERGWLLRDERLLGQTGGFEIAFQIPPPGLELVVLLLELASHRTQAQLGIDPRPRSIDRKST